MSNNTNETIQVDDTYTPRNGDDTDNGKTEEQSGEDLEEELLQRLTHPPGWFRDWMEEQRLFSNKTAETIDFLSKLSKNVDLNKLAEKHAQKKESKKPMAAQGFVLGVLSSERTLLGWARTSAQCVGIGVALVRLLEYRDNTLLIATGTTLVVAGLIYIIYGVLRHLVAIRAISIAKFPLDIVGPILLLIFGVTGSVLGLLLVLGA